LYVMNPVQNKYNTKLKLSLKFVHRNTHDTNNLRQYLKKK